MFTNRCRIHVLAILTLQAAAILVLNVGATSIARADYVTTHDDGNGFYIMAYWDDKGKLKSQHYFDPDGERYLSQYYDNPSADGQPTGVMPDKEAIVELLKKMGGAWQPKVDFWKTPLGLHLIQSGKGPKPLVDPAPVGAAGYDVDVDGGGGAGGFDPGGGPIGEQVKGMLKKGKKKDSGDDGDDDAKPGDAGLWGQEYPANPELVNPVPAKTFVLMSPARSVSPSGAQGSSRNAPPSRLGTTLNIGAFGSFGGGYTAPRSTAVLASGR